MPFLSRKRKRMVAENGSSSSMANTSDVEVVRTDDTNGSRLSGIGSDVLLTQSQSLDKSQTQINIVSQEVGLEDEVWEPMAEQTVVESMDEQMSNRWADDLNISLEEPTDTQIGRNVQKKTLEAQERAKLNIAECGTIESITLHNFMCHSNFHLDFGPRINFIVGRNGSGKSAILTAIVLGLGGRASTTNRGKGIASFIKSGETQAKIILNICNSNANPKGKQGYRPDVYGKTITIERTINGQRDGTKPELKSGTATYKIKSANGQTVGDRREHLEPIIRHFDIQIDNPICVLNQEVSRNFLNTKNSRDKYVFFMKATLLEDMKNDYAASETDRAISNKILDQKMAIIPEMTKDVKQLERKVRMFNELDNHKEKFTNLNNEALWALVCEQRHKLEVLWIRVEKYQKKLDLEMSKIVAEKAVIGKLETDKTETLNRINNLVEEVERIQAVYDEYKQLCNDIKDQIRAKERDERNIRTELMAINRDMNRLEDKIKDLEKQFSEESHSNRKLEISKLKEEIEKLKEEENRLLQSSQELNQLMTQMADEGQRLSQEFRQLSASISSKVRDIDRLNQSRNERLQRFGPKFPELVKRVAEAHRKGQFKHKPLGPIGNHIQLQDYSCALAVEVCLKGLLYAFCCDNMDDRKVLEQIMRSVFRNERIPSIVTRPFGPLHDVRQYRVQSDEYKSLLDLMVINEAPIANCLIDQLHIESILYVPDYKKAEELLMNRSTVPKNCYQAYTSEACVMFPNSRDSDYKSYANNNKKSANILMKSVDQMLETLKQELSTLEEQRKNSDRQVADNRKALELKRRELSAFESRKKQIRTDCIKRDTKLQELEAIGDSPPVEISTLEEELETYGLKKFEFDRQLEAIKKEKEELHESYTEADNQMRAKKQDYDSLLAGRHPMKEHLDKIKNDLTNHGLVLAKYDKQLAETQLLKTEEDKKLTAKQTELADDEATALANTGQPVETKRSSKTVFNEIKQMEKFLDEQENSIGNKDEIYAKYRELTAHYKRCNQEVTALKQHLKNLKDSLELRRRGYVDLRNFYSLMTKFFFSDVLKHKGFSGGLEIYHNQKEVNGELKKAKTLEIRVNPKSDVEPNGGKSQSSGAYSDTRSLSGGERSYSTVAFILALWESAQSPFKILDEVDVFMDLVTRKISLDAMIEFASQKSGKQYIFLSPLKLQNLPSPDLIKIFQMPEPRRTD